MVPKSSTLDDLEWADAHYGSKHVSFRAYRKNMNEDRTMLSAAHT